MAAYTEENKKLGRRIVEAHGSDEQVFWCYNVKNGLTSSAFSHPATRQTAFLWLHGKEQPGMETGPGVDEMLEAIAAKLVQDTKLIMETCAENEQLLRDLYSRSKKSGLMVGPIWR